MLPEYRADDFTEQDIRPHAQPGFPKFREQGPGIPSHIDPGANFISKQGKFPCQHHPKKKCCGQYHRERRKTSRVLRVRTGFVHPNAPVTMPTDRKPLPQSQEHDIRAGAAGLAGKPSPRPTGRRAVDRSPSSTSATQLHAILTQIALRSCMVGRELEAFAIGLLKKRSGKFSPGAVVVLTGSIVGHGKRKGSPIARDIEAEPHPPIGSEEIGLPIDIVEAAG